MISISSGWAHTVREAAAPVLYRWRDFWTHAPASPHSLLRLGDATYFESIAGDKISPRRKLWKRTNTHAREINMWVLFYFDSTYPASSSLASALHSVWKAAIRRSRTFLPRRSHTNSYVSGTARSGKPSHTLHPPLTNLEMLLASLISDLLIISSTTFW